MKTLLTSIFIYFILVYQTYSQSMPQIFGKLPMDFKGSELVVINLTTTADVINELVPEPLVPNQDNNMTIAFGMQKVLGNQDYHEMYILIPSSYKGKAGGYLPILYLDEVAPLVAGREIVGFPKVNGEFEIKKEENSISVSISRNGFNILEFSALLSNPSPQLIETGDSIGYVIKEIPSAEGNSTPALLRLNSYNYKDANIYDIQNCSDIKLKLNESKQHFMPEVIVKKVNSAIFIKTDFTIDYGNIEYDYLKNR